MSVPVFASSRPVFHRPPPSFHVRLPNCVSLESGFTWQWRWNDPATNSKRRLRNFSITVYLTEPWQPDPDHPSHLTFEAPRHELVPLPLVALYSHTDHAFRYSISDMTHQLWQQQMEKFPNCVHLRFHVRSQCPGRQESHAYILSLPCRAHPHTSRVIEVEAPLKVFKNEERLLARVACGALPALSPHQAAALADLRRRLPHELRDDDRAQECGHSGACHRRLIATGLDQVIVHVDSDWADLTHWAVTGPQGLVGCTLSALSSLHGDAGRAPQDFALAQRGVVWLFQQLWGPYHRTLRGPYPQQSPPRALFIGQREESSARLRALRPGEIRFTDFNTCTRDQLPVLVVAQVLRDLDPDSVRDSFVFYGHLFMYLCHDCPQHWPAGEESYVSVVPGCVVNYELFLAVEHTVSILNIPPVPESTPRSGPELRPRVGLEEQKVGTHPLEGSFEDPHPNFLRFTPRLDSPTTFSQPDGSDEQKEPHVGIHRLEELAGEPLTNSPRLPPSPLSPPVYLVPNEEMDPLPNFLPLTPPLDSPTTSFQPDEGMDHSD